MILYHSNGTLDIDGMIGEGWVYKDIDWCFADIFDEVADIIGPDNLIYLAGSSKIHNGREAMRGQFLISEEGIRNLEKWRANFKAS